MSLASQGRDLLLDYSWLTLPARREDGEALSSVLSTALAAGKLIHNPQSQENGQDEQDEPQATSAKTSLVERSKKGV